jgi:polyisoprenoid-binding protein YceI
MKMILPLLLMLASATAALAEPHDYVLQPKASIVGFETDFGPDKITGHFPVTRADLRLDFQNLAASTVAVTLNVASADASFPFAAQALKGPKVLDARQYPEITFQSTSVRKAGDGAEVKGNITIRGVSRPTVLQAGLYRQQGTAPGDLSLLTVHLTGAVNRSDFGATGWSDMVGDQVRMDIVAQLKRTD